MKSDALVILSPGFPANENDTTCLPNQQVFAKTLARLYPDVQVIVIAFQYPFRKDDYRWHNVQVISLNGRRKGNLKRRITWLKAVVVVYRLRRRYNLLGLLSFWLDECALVGSYLSKWLKVKHRVWLLGQDAKAGNRYAKILQPTPQELIALSDFISDEYEKNYDMQPAHTVPVGINTSLFTKKPVSRSIDILGAGSLIPLKQYELFVEAVRFATYFFPNLQAVICGQGVEEEKLRLMIDGYNLGRNIKLLGEVPHHEVISLMQASKVFLHPSNYEGFGTVIAEALYAGAQLISFCKPMKTDFANHFVVNGAHEMQTKLVELLKEPERYHEPVLMYSAEEVATKMMALFRPE